MTVTAGTPPPRGAALMPADFMTAIRGVPPARPLTRRETQLLALVAEGCTNPEIGRELHITANTVTTGLKRVRRKLGAKDRAHAVALAFRAGVLQ